MNFAPMVVNFLGFKVNVVDKSAIVNVGPNQQFDIFVSTKWNQGIGEENGDISAVYIPITFVNDTDVNDSNSLKTSFI
ncbi:hypothetical protein [Falsibacillus pallidus]|uniref:Spore germination protein GerPA/GerPF n=1 Tax=Falsibacillus pallidus TaxID=493781 RepID=A0A370GIM7_9BACI|nr:hypothetical protein [Falsibacillus pallidus]RDI43220.1 hypothetical protein DFR59_104275 [Falsibacillus pallidus]